MDKKFGDKQQNHKGYNPKADMKFFETVAFPLMLMAHHNISSLLLIFVVGLISVAIPKTNYTLI
ncbi:hypothetical protein [Legionella taurinensis]|jgi:hypothetical protein|uniref:hypothetical protein n=1 Tax=Legionella taurinensis TaxID=70611 RepID=UPI0010AB0E3F|nr:hypothetical protein [Legionella taurinensis]